MRCAEGAGPSQAKVPSQYKIKLCKAPVATISRGEAEKMQFCTSESLLTVHKLCMHAMTRWQNGQRHNLLTLAENVLIHLAGEICDNGLVDCIKGKSSSTGRPCAYCPCNGCNTTAQLRWANGRITDLEYQK